MFEFGASDSDRFRGFPHGFGQTEMPQARIVKLSIEPEQVVVLHVRPGYVSSVRGVRSSWVTPERLRPNTPKPNRRLYFSKRRAPSQHKPMH